VIELTTEHLVYMNIGRRYWGAELADASDEQRKALRGYVTRFKRMLAKGTGLFLCGPNGSGKTFISAALLKEAWARWRVTGYCVTAAELKHCWIDDVLAHLGSGELMRDRVETCRLLVIDDLGKEHRAASGYAETQVGALLRHRSRHVLTTIVTTNLKPEPFAEVYGASTAKLLKECALPVLLKDRDHRDDAAKAICRETRT